MKHHQDLELKNPVGDLTSFGIIRQSPDKGPLEPKC